MDGKRDVKEVQGKILEVMKYIDKLCRDNGIIYYIMGGTALGAVRHGGFIPWDDDLDIFMTPSEYEKFKKVFESENSSIFVLQEWRTTPHYLEYAKVRMNGTTFIEEAFKDRKNLHQGIYVDIMILHKIPENKYIQKIVYYESKFVTLYALSQRNWKPKSTGQKMVLKSLKFMPRIRKVRIISMIFIFIINHNICNIRIQSLNPRATEEIPIRGITYPLHNRITMLANCDDRKA